MHVNDIVSVITDKQGCSFLNFIFSGWKSGRNHVFIEPFQNLFFKLIFRGYIYRFKFKNDSHTASTVPHAASEMNITSLETPLSQQDCKVG